MQTSEMGTNENTNTEISKAGLNLGRKLCARVGYDHLQSEDDGEKMFSGL